MHTIDVFTARLRWVLPTTTAFTTDLRDELPAIAPVLTTGLRKTVRAKLAVSSDSQSRLP